MRRLHIVFCLLVIFPAAMPHLAFAQGKDTSPEGTVLRVNEDVVYVELPGTITVEPGTVGRVLQERPIAGKVRQIRAALLETVRVERNQSASWIAICRVTGRTQPLASGNRVAFDAAQPRPAMLAIRSQPNGALVYLDGSQVGAAPVQKEIAPGTYQIRLERDGYKPAAQLVLLKAGEEKEVTIALESQVGTLSVSSEPEGATVRIEGEDAGQTPLTTPLYPGVYQVRLEREGFEAETETVRISASEEAQVSAVLRRPLNVRFSPSQSALVDNASLAREEGRLLIRYDLEGEEDEYEVQLLLSTDGGRSFAPLPETVAGAVGKDTAPGTGKQIVWAALEDFPQGFAGQNNQVRLAVEDQGRGGLLWVIGGAIAAGAGTTVGLLLGGGGGSGSTGGSPPSESSGIPTPPTPPN